MAFITRTRIILYADLVNGEQVALSTPTVFKTGPVGTVAQTMADAMALVPVGQRPASDNWWKYLLQWEVQSNVIPTLRGVIPDTGRLVFDVDFWETEAIRLSNVPPARRNTFTHEFTTKRLAGANTEIRQSIDDYLLRATFGNFPADGRDTRIVTTNDLAHDPLSLMGRPAITNLNGQPIDLPSRWRTF